MNTEEATTFITKELTTQLNKIKSKFNRDLELEDLIRLYMKTTTLDNETAYTYLISYFNTILDILNNDLIVIENSFEEYQCGLYYFLLNSTKVEYWSLFINDIHKGFSGYINTAELLHNMLEDEESELLKKEPRIVLIAIATTTSLALEYDLSIPDIKNLFYGFIYNKTPVYTLNKHDDCITIHDCLNWYHGTTRQLSVDYLIKYGKNVLSNSVKDDVFNYALNDVTLVTHKSIDPYFIKIGDLKVSKNNDSNVLLKEHLNYITEKLNLSNGIVSDIKKLLEIDKDLSVFDIINILILPKKERDIARIVNHKSEPTLSFSISGDNEIYRLDVNSCL